MPTSYAAVARRLEKLERDFDGGPPRGPGGPGGGWGPDGEADRLRRKFLSSFLHALGHVRRQSLDAGQPYGYDLEATLRGGSPFVVASYVAALRYLGHPDEYEAVDILNSMCSERDIDQTPLTTLISLAVRLASEASDRAS